MNRKAFASAADFAYTKLRRDIMDGRLSPGHRMREQELSEDLGMSRTPIREALSRLQADGLLAIQGRSGLAVAELDDAGVVELYETREAAHLAALHANPRDIALLEAELTVEAVVAADPVQQQRRNRAFHAAILAASHNRFLARSLLTLHDALALLGPTTLSVDGRLTKAQQEHRRILEAIIARDPKTAETEMRAHVRAGAAIRQELRRIQGGHKI